MQTVREELLLVPFQVVIIVANIPIEFKVLIVHNIQTVLERNARVIHNHIPSDDISFSFEVNTQLAQFDCQIFGTMDDGWHHLNKWFELFRHIFSC